MGSSAINLAGQLAPAQFRNKIINGNFDIWQRGITFGTFDGTLTYGPGDGNTGANGLANLAQIRNNPWVSSIGQRGGAQADSDIIKDQAYTADRWRLSNRSGWKGHIVRKEFDWSVDNDDLLPAGSAPARYYMEHSTEVETNNSYISQRIEDITIFNSEKITVSFYARKVDTATRTDSTVNRITASLVAYTKCTGSNISNGGNSDSQPGSPLYEVPSDYDVYIDNSQDTKVLTDDWQKYSWTFTIPEMAGKVDGNGNAVTPGEGFWMLDFRPSSSYGDPWKGAVHYAQVQVEKRDDTTEFEVLPPGIELQRCQRYFQKSLDMDIVPGSSYFDIKANYLHGGLPDDAALDDSSGQVMGYDDDQAYFHMPGTVAQTHHDSAIGSGFYYRSTMRNTPEVLIYNPYTGNRGRIHSNDDAGEKNVLWIEAIAQNSVGTVVSHASAATPPSVVTYYWTADAEL